MTVRCASCGWTEDVGPGDESIYGANHLRVCPKRDDLRFVPWWTWMHPTAGEEREFEVGWHTIDVNDPEPSYVGYLESPPSTYRQRTPAVRYPTRRYRFTEYGEREIIGVRRSVSDDEFLPNIQNLKAEA